MAKITGGREKVRRKTNIGKPSRRSLTRDQKIKNSSSLEKTVRKKTRKRSQKCPLCTWEIRLTRHAKPGDLILCKGCGAKYEQRSIHPLHQPPENFYNNFGRHPASI